MTMITPTESPSFGIFVNNDKFMTGAGPSWWDNHSTNDRKGFLHITSYEFFSEHFPFRKNQPRRPIERLFTDFITDTINLHDKCRPEENPIRCENNMTYCQGGWTADILDGHNQCFKYVRGPETQWNTFTGKHESVNAKSICSNLDAHLPLPNSSDQYAQLRELFRSMDTYGPVIGTGMYEGRVYNYTALTFAIQDNEMLTKNTTNAAKEIVEFPKWIRNIPFAGHYANSKYAFAQMNFVPTLTNEQWLETFGTPYSDYNPEYEWGVTTANSSLVDVYCQKNPHCVQTSQDVRHEDMMDIAETDIPGITGVIERDAENFIYMLGRFVKNAIYDKGGKCECRGERMLNRLERLRWLLYYQYCSVVSTSHQFCLEFFINTNTDGQGVKSIRDRKHPAYDAFPRSKRSCKLNK